MSTYAISYDLNSPGQDYEGLHRTIKSCGNWWHHLDSFWLVSTSLSAQEIFNRIREEIDSGDNLLVIRVTKDYQGWLPKNAWDWLNSHINERAFAA